MGWSLLSRSFVIVFKMDGLWIRITLATQQLEVFHANNTLLKRYPVSTAALGAGEQIGSLQTPRGLHEIRARIGVGVPLNTVFVERRLTGEIYSPTLGRVFKERDWILTRILWLRGLEKGKNRLGSCDTMRRYIYIHGTAHEKEIGQAVSRGCIRMYNQDIIELFEWVKPGTKVRIDE
jgi:hypothetical protein